MQRALPWPANKLSYLTIACKNVNSTTYPRVFKLQPTILTLQGDVTVNQIRTPWLAPSLGGHGQALHTVKAAKRWCELLYNYGASSKCDHKSNKLWYRTNERNFLQFRMEAWKIQNFNVVWTRDLAMKPLTLGTGQLWVLMRPWGMNEWWNDI